MTTTLGASTHHLGEAALARLSSTHPQLRTASDAAADRCRAEIHDHLAHLSVALWADEPDLFIDHARWAARRSEVEQTMPSSGRNSFLQHQEYAAPPPRACGPRDTLLALLDTLQERLRDHAEAAAATALVRAGLLAVSSPHRRTIPSLRPLSPIAAQYLELLLSGREGDAAALVRHAIQQHTLLDTYNRVLMPALRELGLRWEAGEVTVAQEHFCTRATQRLMTALSLDLLPTSNAVANRRALVLCPQGEQHCIGGDAFTDLLSADGWIVRCLGANTPARSVVPEVYAFSPNLLAVSMTVAPAARTAADAIAAAKSAAAWRLCTMVGGPLVARYPRVAHATGADFFATDFETGLDMARSVPIEREDARRAG